MSDDDYYQIWKNGHSWGGTALDVGEPDVDHYEDEVIRASKLFK